jgi:hypothetical protein
MSTTDFSIADEPFVDFKTSGWPQDKREQLTDAFSGMPGVTSVGYAGGGDTTRVRFDPTRTTREAIIDAAGPKANEILPGHNFG